MRKKVVRNVTESGTFSPVWCVAITQVFGLLEKNECCSSRGCQQHPHLHPSRHPGTSLHPDGQRWKTNQGCMGMKVGAMYGCWEPHGQAICHDEEGPSPFPPLGLSMSSHIPFKPHCTLLQCLASRLTRYLPRCLVCPPRKPWENCIRSHHLMEN